MCRKTRLIGGFLLAIAMGSMSCIISANAEPSKNTTAKKKPETGENLYERGMKVLQVDPPSSILLFQRAAKEGHVKSMTRLGYCFQTGTGARANRNMAIKWYEKAVAAGDPTPQYQLGLLYEESTEKKDPIDYARAIEWYEKAVARNSIPACAALARIYASCSNPEFHNGEKAVKYAIAMVKSKPDEANSYDLLAAAYARNLQFDLAVKTANQAIGMSQMEDLETRQKRRDEYAIGQPFPNLALDSWIFMAADQNSQWAMLKLAQRHEESTGDMYSLQKARYWYERAIKSGSKNALVKFGEMCKQGLGGPVDQAMAFKCFKQAAEAGIAESYLPLGKMYIGGPSPNLKLAQECYQKAKELGMGKTTLEFSALQKFGESMEHRSKEDLYKLGKECFLDHSGNTTQIFKSFTAFWIAAEKGHVGAMQETANCYFYGPAYFQLGEEPVPAGSRIKINYNNASEWYERLHQAGVTAPEYEKCREIIKTKKGNANRTPLTHDSD